MNAQRGAVRSTYPITFEADGTFSVLVNVKKVRIGESEEFNVERTVKKCATLDEAMRHLAYLHVQWKERGVRVVDADVKAFLVDTYHTIGRLAMLGRAQYAALAAKKFGEAKSARTIEDTIAVTFAGARGVRGLALRSEKWEPAKETAPKTGKKTKNGSAVAA